MLSSETHTYSRTLTHTHIHESAYTAPCEYAHIRFSKCFAKLMTKLPRVSLPQKPLVVCAPSVDVSARLLSQVCPGQQHTLLASTVPARHRRVPLSQAAPVTASVFSWVFSRVNRSLKEMYIFHQSINTL